MAYRIGGGRGGPEGDILPGAVVAVVLNPIQMLRYA